MFGPETNIYAVGFSLGSNCLLKHLGTHLDCEKECNIKAAVSISGAFELPATALTINKRYFGLFDWYMLQKLKRTFA